MTDKSAFPHAPQQAWNPETYTYETAKLSPGMTFREWQWTQFAAAALQALIPTSQAHADSVLAHAEALGIPTADAAKTVALLAQHQATAMMRAIAEREEAGS